MFRNNIHGIIFIVIVTAALPSISGQINAADYEIDHNSKGYVLDKFQSHDLVLLGTRHKQKPIFRNDKIVQLWIEGFSRTVSALGG